MIVAPDAEALIKKVCGYTGNFWEWEACAKEAGEEAKKLSTQSQIDFVMEVAALQANRGSTAPHMLLAKSLSAVLRKKLPFTTGQIHTLVRLAENPTYYYPFATVLRLAESIPMTPELNGLLRQM